MGAYTTLRVSRKAARLAFLRLAFKPSDEFLESFLDEAFNASLFNVQIVGDEDGDDDDILDRLGEP